MKRRRWLAGLVLIAWAAWSWAWFFPPRPRVGPLSVFDSPYASVLLFAPHSDDETLAAAGLLQQAEEEGLEPHVVLVTAGDGFVMAARAQIRRWRVGHLEMLSFGEHRLTESYQGLAALGLPADRLIFLGYPDGRLDRLWSTCWASPCVGPRTGVESVPYSNARTPGAPFAGQSLYQELVALLREHRPALVVYPHPNDAHGDHWALSVFLTAALEELRRGEPGWDPPEEWLYLVHRGDWPAPKGYRPAEPLLPPERLASGSTTAWHQISLTPDQVNRKAEAVRAYQSQLSLMRRYLLSFVRANELFGILPRAEVPSSEPLESPSGIDHLGHPPWSELPWQLVMADPRADTVGREVERGADLLRIWAANDGESLHLAVRTAAPPRRRLRLHLHARGLHPDGWGEMVEVAIYPDGSHQVRAWPAETSQDEVATSVRGDWSRLTLPLGPLGQPASILINLESYRDQARIDRTAWRLLVLDGISAPEDGR